MSNDGQGLLHHALLSPDPSCAGKLLDVYAHRLRDINAADVQGRTPLHVAAFRPVGVDLVQALLSAGADPTVVDDNSHTPESLATRTGRSEVATVLATASQAKQS